MSKSKYTLDPTRQCDVFVGGDVWLRAQCNRDVVLGEDVCPTHLAARKRAAANAEARRAHKETVAAEVEAIAERAEAIAVQFGITVAIEYRRGEFPLRPTGRLIIGADDLEALVAWTTLARRPKVSK